MPPRHHLEINWLRLLLWWTIGAVGVVGGWQKLIDPTPEPKTGYSAIAIGIAAFVVGSITAIRRATQIASICREELTAECPNDVRSSRLDPFFAASVAVTLGQKLVSVHYLVPGGESAEDLTPLAHATESCWGLELVMEQANLAIFFVGQDPTTLEVTLGDRTEPPAGTIRRVVFESSLWASIIGEVLRAVIPTEAIGFSNPVSWRPIEPSVLARLRQEVMDRLPQSDGTHFDLEAFLRSHLAESVQHVRLREVTLIFKSCEVRVGADTSSLELSRLALE